MKRKEKNIGVVTNVIFIYLLIGTFIVQKKLAFNGDENIYENINQAGNQFTTIKAQN